VAGYEALSGSSGVKNLAASVRARLANHSREAGIPLAVSMERFALGRLLWRLSRSTSADRFVLKEAQLFALWAEASHRPTRDVDFLGSGDSSPESLKQFFDALLAGPAEPEDGLAWEEVEAATIREDQLYQGVRVVARAKLAEALVRVQIDVGFGDAITPEAIEVEWRELLGFPEARLLAYPPETVIAEKLEAATVLGLANSRMKDFFDLDWLCRHREFDLAVLQKAVRNTFARRGTPMPKSLPVALTSEFGSDSDKLTQWSAFLRKNNLEADSLGAVVARLAEFLGPVLGKEEAVLHWRPGKKWSDCNTEPTILEKDIPTV
jgi:hypothetical protein